MYRLRQITFAALFMMVTAELAAQSKPINVVTTAVPFLRISSDTRASGMGGVGIATAPGINAVYWNGAKLPFATAKAAISANYSPWLKEWGSDMHLASLAGYYKISDDEAIHGLVRYFTPGDLQFVDNSGNYLQTYHPNEFGVDIGYSRKLSQKNGIGISVKYIHSDLAGGTTSSGAYRVGHAIAADLGFYSDLRKEDKSGWSFGAALSNLGSKISYSKTEDQSYFLPANLGLGASYTKAFDEENILSFGLDVNKLLVPTAPLASDSSALLSYRNKSVVGSWFSSFSDAPEGFKEELREFQVSVGAEYCYRKQFALRGGYFYENRYKGDRKYFSLGAGVAYHLLEIDFSYLIPSSKGINKNPLSNTLQFGLTLHFSNK